MRYPLTYEVTAEPEIVNHSIIKWILQPIVENAIIHGIDPLRSEGNITINARSDKDRILFSITDNGVGIEPSKLSEIREQLKYGSATLTKYKNRVGLYNVQTRILSHYGDEFGLSIESTVNKGTSVTITLPKEEGGNGNA
jgi:two-component system sensor histidine kinase YesM